MPNRNLLLSSGKQTISVTLKVINSSGNAIKNARIEIQELGSFTTDNNVTVKYSWKDCLKMKSIELQFLRLDIPRLATDLLQILTPYKNTRLYFK